MPLGTVDFFASFSSSSPEATQQTHADIHDIRRCTHRRTDGTSIDRPVTRLTGETERKIPLRLVTHVLIDIWYNIVLCHTTNPRFFNSLLLCYHSNSSSTRSSMRSQHRTKFVRRNLTLIDTLQGLHELLTSFLTRLGKQDCLWLAHLTQQLSNTRIGLAACARLLHADDYPITQRNNRFDAQYVAKERLRS